MPPSFLQKMVALVISLMQDIAASRIEVLASSLSFEAAKF
jgi:hypothetical protein